MLFPQQFSEFEVSSGAGWGAFGHLSTITRCPDKNMAFPGWWPVIWELGMLQKIHQYQVKRYPKFCLASWLIRYITASVVMCFFLIRFYRRFLEVYPPKFLSVDPWLHNFFRHGKNHQLWSPCWRFSEGTGADGHGCEPGDGFLCKLTCETQDGNRWILFLPKLFSPKCNIV